MSNEVKFEIQGGEKLATLGPAFEQAYKEELSAALDEVIGQGERIVRDTIREANAVASGLTLNSVTSLIRRSGKGEWRLGGEIIFKSPVDRIVDFVDGGRGSGKMPPVERIKAWARVKGIPENLSYPIARSIGAKGTAVGGWSRYNRTSFLDTSARKIDVVSKKEFERIADRVQRRLDAHADNNSRRT